MGMSPVFLENSEKCPLFKSDRSLPPTFLKLWAMDSTAALCLPNSHPFFSVGVFVIQIPMSIPRETAQPNLPICIFASCCDERFS